MSQTHESEPTISEVIASGMFKGGNRPSHDALWNEIEPDEAPLARSALVRAESLKVLGIGAREAYLQGIADALGFMHRKELASMFYRDSSAMMVAENPPQQAA